jgi:hypothetical protein
MIGFRYYAGRSFSGVYASKGGDKYELNYEKLWLRQQEIKKHKKGE